MSASSRARRGRVKIGSVLRYLFALAVLYLVAQSVPWSDRLEIGDPDAGEPRVLVGLIEGDWNADGVFDQEDIVAALATGNYLQGPYIT